MINGAFFIRLILAALIFVGLSAAIPAFAAIVGFTLDANWAILVKVACAAVAVYYLFFGRPQSL